MLKMTNRIALTTAIESLSTESTFTYTVGEETLTFTGAELIAKLQGMVEQLDKKSAAPKKPTAKQVAALGEAEEVYEALVAVGKAVTVSELMEAVPALVEKFKSNQKVSALLRKLEESGKVTKTIEKRKSYFQAV